MKEAEESVTIQDTQDADMDEEAVDEDEVMEATEPVAPTTAAEPEYEPKVCIMFKTVISKYIWALK